MKGSGTGWRFVLPEQGRSKSPTTGPVQSWIEASDVAGNEDSVTVGKVRLRIERNYEGCREGMWGVGSDRGARELYNSKQTLGEGNRGEICVGRQG